MKKITATELNNCLASHKLWVETQGKQGIRADLQGADLTGADLTGAKLTGAYLSGAKLTGADLTGANLAGANLYCAGLTDANLTNAILTGTILEKKKENPPEIASVKSENVSTTRQAFEKLAKEHGMKIASLTLELL